MTDKNDSTLKLLNPLVGEWTTEATHPAMPGVIVHGTVSVEWLEGEKFLIHRAHTDHPDFPDSVSIIGSTRNDRVDEGTGDLPAGSESPSLQLHYYDSRGVFREYDLSAEQHSFSYVMIAPGFSQRFNGTFEDGGNTLDGISQLRRDDINWVDDLKITYRRRK